MFRRTTLALLFCIAFAPLEVAIGQAAASTVAPVRETLRATCERFAEEHGVVGLGFAVIDDGRILCDEAVGFAERESARPAKTTTLYRLGSISKPVCATIAMQLVGEHVLALDRGIGGSVPDLPETLRPLTLAQLLSHTSGVRHYAPGKDDNGTQHRSTREALALFVDDPLLFAPGTKYSYSTHAYTLVAAAIESATKRDYVATLRERMHAVAPTLDCEVLGEMKPERSSLYDKLASGEVVLRTEREDNSWKYGGGGLESTALDLARFAQALLDGKLVPGEARDRMWSPTKLADGSISRYGLGWSVAEDGKSVSHSGSQQGCHSMLIVVPGEELVIAVLTNTQGCGAPELGRQLRAVLAKAAPTAPAPAKEGVR
ncbi:MAG TPA: serine hydrolase domain-containing protein [Planctomycetota bacterium]|nr:serine hydrolase domain-containing protein [Planctomycetota bacterium]